MAVSPAARSVSVQQGNAAPSDNATVTLTGTNASSTAWTATKRQPWLTFTNASGTGSGSVTWNRDASGLAVGTYVDTITVASAGIAGSPATVYDTLKITAAPIPVVMAVSPRTHTTSVPQGTTAPGDNSTVTLTGTNASTTAWSATTKRPWLILANANGTGSGMVSWYRDPTGLAVGTYVDTITVTASGVTGSPVLVFDTLKITAVAPTIDLPPHGKKERSVQFSGGTKLSLPDVDSVMVVASVPDSIAAGGWIASVSSSRLVLVTSAGSINSYVKWSRSPQAFDPGLYVDTVSVSMVLNSSVRAQFIDSLEVVDVSLPAPDVAVGDLFDHASLTADQRTALDRQGNNNGVYDLGDFLAWVTRNNIQLSAATSLKMKQAAMLVAAPTPAKPAPGGP